MPLAIVGTDDTPDRERSPVPVARRRRKKKPHPDGHQAGPRPSRGKRSRKPTGRGPSPARLAAARALIQVEEGAHVEDVLARIAPEEPRDRAHAWFLALGVLRHRASVDAALRPLLSRPLGGMDAEVRAVLRLGTFEKLHGRAGDHAVINEAVEVVKTIMGARASGLVNAVLRRVRPVKLSADDALDHPAWLLARWRSRYGAEATEAWARANNEPAPLTLVALGDHQELADALTASDHAVGSVTLGGRALPGVLRLQAPEGPVTALPGFDEGRFWVQDPAAVAVADLAQARPGLRVLDACAAPGGKTFRLMSQGAEVTAVDHQGARLQRLRDGLTRLGLSPTIRHHDWTEGPLPDAGEPFDVVLVDAPCSGLGTVRRHPEIRWRRQLIDVLGMPTTQRQILEGAAHHVAPGGVLIYAVCSPEPEEGSDVVAAFMAAHPEFREERRLSTAPPTADEDAHFAAVLRRSGGGPEGRA